MASITQKINSVNGGISQQPDELKIPGQVVSAKNVLPDITHGLQKRPGSKLITALNQGSRSSYTTGKWFSYYRDENEQYIGQVIRRKNTNGSSHADDGTLRMWRCSDGHPMTVVLGAENRANNTAYALGDRVVAHSNVYECTTAGTSHSISAHPGGTGENISDGTVKWKFVHPVSELTDYLIHSGDDDIQTLTLNDTTFISNRTKPTGMTADVEPLQPHQAFVELKQLKYASQYNLEIFNTVSNPSSISTATKLDVAYTLHASNQYAVLTTGTCDSVGTQIFTVNIGDTNSYVQATDKDGNTISGRGTNLYFRITTTGQPTTTGGSNPTYVCRYTVKCDLLYGGEGWNTGDVIRVRLTNAAVASDYFITVVESSSSSLPANLCLCRPSPTPFNGDSAITADMILGAIRNEILDVTNSATDSTIPTVTGDYAQLMGTHANKKIAIYSTNHGKSVGDKVNLTLTADTSPDATGRPADGVYTIVDSFTDQFNVLYSENNTYVHNNTENHEGTFSYPVGVTGFTVEQIGSGLYIKRTDAAFNINTGVTELLNVLTNEVQDVADLPKQCKDGYVVKVRNSANDEDDYYVKFIANRDLDGEGVWEECAEPGRRIKIDPAKMPIQLQRTAVFDSSNTDSENNPTPKFMLSQIDWEDCFVGSPLTAPKPSFISTVAGVDDDDVTVNRYINKMIFFRNRLVLLSDENVIMSRPGDFFNFFAKSAIANSAEDPIDLSCSSEYPAIVYDGIQVNTGLVLFTKNQQFMLTTDSDVLSPITAKINALSTYNFNEKTNPISLGTTVAFLDNAGKFTRMFEMASVLREGEPIILEQSKIISKLFPKNINLIANSRENSLIIFAEKSSNKIYCYRYYTSNERRLMQSWFTWELSEPIQHLCMLDDSIYAVVGTTGNYVLQRINVKLSDDATESITQTDKTYKVHLDNISEIALSTGTYSTSDNQTEFTRPAGYNSNRQLAIYDIDTDDDIGVYVSKRSDGTSAVNFLPDGKLHIDGNWSGHVKTITVTNQGSGYTSAPSVNFSGGGGTGAVAVANFADGKVTSITITNGGYNYTASPTITLTGGNGPSDTTATATASIDGTNFLLGYTYDMEIEFPKFYYTQQSGERYISDVQSNLVIHRIKFNFGPLGTYQTTLKRTGKADYVETFESQYADQYAANTLVIDPEQEVTLPIYERNTNYTLTLKSEDPSPATLYSMAWEGDYTNSLYKRV